MVSLGIFLHVFLSGPLNFSKYFTPFSIFNFTKSPPKGCKRPLLGVAWFSLMSSSSDHVIVWVQLERLYDSADLEVHCINLGTFSLEDVQETWAFCSICSTVSGLWKYSYKIFFFILDWEEKNQLDNHKNVPLQLLLDVLIFRISGINSTHIF